MVQLEIEEILGRLAQLEKLAQPDKSDQPELEDTLDSKEILVELDRGVLEQLVQPERLDQ